MLIGELALKTNLSRHTIRFYEKLGLLSLPENSRRENNYKEYPEATLTRIMAIKEITAKGFTLKEVKGIIHLLNEGELDPDRGRKYVQRKIRLIDQQINSLTQVRKSLSDMITNHTEGEPCEVRQLFSAKFETVSPL